MKILLSARALFFLGFAIIVATNIVVLTGAAANRAGIPESRLFLTERELRLPFRTQVENSGLALQLSWQVLGKNEDRDDYVGRRSPAWFDGKKLESLGFKVDELSSMEEERYYGLPLAKEVYIVLEKDGEPYRSAVKRAEAAFIKEEELLTLNPGNTERLEKFKMAQTSLENLRTTVSRLFAVDAGLDPKTLRRQYGDQARFIITRGLVQPTFHGEGKSREMVGLITELSVESIHVPLNHRQIFDAVLAARKSQHNEFGPPRYQVELAYGSRFEPWIISVASTDDQADRQR